jgi:hypothetical protein
MRIFHVSVYEGFMSAGQTVYSSPSLSELFGSVDRLYVSGYASQISASFTPQLQIQEEISIDGENWTGGAVQVLALQLLTQPETPFQGTDFDPDNPIFGVKPPFRRLNITVSTAGSSAMLHIWATGRDRARGSRTLARAG